jgi:hypothetical protein
VYLLQSLPESKADYACANDEDRIVHFGIDYSSIGVALHGMASATGSVRGSDIHADHA